MFCFLTSLEMRRKGPWSPPPFEALSVAWLCPIFLHQSLQQQLLHSADSLLFLLVYIVPAVLFAVSCGCVHSSMISFQALHEQCCLVILFLICVGVITS